MIDPSIKGRIAIVTGANQGIRVAAAHALANQGVAVFLTYLRLGPDNPSVQATGLPTPNSRHARTCRGHMDRSTDEWSPSL
jgi:NAD(P)-dependent dehydrogenase (short-subunit alcohol dehydrogenase family)